MKINFEKKHLYIISGVILLLFSSVYVIAQTSFTSPAWTAEKQSHGVLYTDIITSKSTTDPNRKVTVEAELDAKGGISLGGIKRTTWPTETGSSTGGGRECYTVQRARTEYGIYEYERLHWLCNSPDRSFQSFDYSKRFNKICINPTSYNTYDELINDWCNVEKGGCTVSLLNPTNTQNGGFDRTILYMYGKVLSAGASASKWFTHTSFDSSQNTFGERSSTGSSGTEIILIKTTNDGACSFSYNNDAHDTEGETGFTGFYFYMDGRSVPVIQQNGCTLMICNNG